MTLDAFDDLAMSAEYPPPAFHTEILRSQTMLLARNPQGVTYHAIAADAWERLTKRQRDEAMYLMLNGYATTVCLDQQEIDHAERVEREAADPTHTYLQLDDVGSLWDSVHVGSEDVPANRAALLNVLAELELLQHRLAMRTNAEEIAMNGNPDTNPHPQPSSPSAPPPPR